tara:strand:+ start:98 stop:457 length:360 start_codon:yes stop_codon:yes gene_type:complete
MGRGAVSRACRMQQRASRAGNPRRGNPFGQDYERGGGLQTNGQLKLLLHKNKQYRIAFDIADGVGRANEKNVFVDSIMYYPHTNDDSWSAIPMDNPLADELCHRLLVTLEVERAMKERK